jgi:hypothetical protein
VELPNFDICDKNIACYNGWWEVIFWSRWRGPVCDRWKYAGAVYISYKYADKYPYENIDPQADIYAASYAEADEGAYGTAYDKAVGYTQSSSGAWKGCDERGEVQAG